MQKIVPHLWFDTQAKEAAEFYTSVFPDSKVVSISQIHGTPSGDADVVHFEIMGSEFMSISAGPYFKPNPSVSFMVNFDAAEDRAIQDIDAIWKKLSEGGKELMPLDVYPFSKKYGWIEDKYGFTWQLILNESRAENRPRIVPSLMFAGAIHGKAEEATDFYISVFKDAERGVISRYPAGAGEAVEGSVMFTDYRLLDIWFAAMDSVGEHDFVFNEAVSLLVRCEDQEEIDYLWEKLSAVPEAEQCGWLKDQYGLSWQIAFKGMDEMMTQGTPDQAHRVTQAFLQMKKFDVAQLEKAYKGE